MTANNVITFDNFVMMFADTAVYSTDTGVITDFASKFHVNEAKRWGALFTGSRMAMDLWCGLLDAASDLDFDGAISLLPGAMREVQERGHPQRYEIVLAGFSAEGDTWRCAQVSNETQNDGTPPYEVRISAGLIRPALSPDGRAELADVEIEQNVRSLGLDEFARRVLSVQRHVHRQRVDGEIRNCAVGGEGELVVITTKAVYRRQVAKWFDVVDETRELREARVAREEIPALVRLSRAERRRAKRAA